MEIDFNKGNGLVPVIVQHNITLQVLMLGYMNEEALTKTKAEEVVTFYSRSKNRLWTKGETSGNTLKVNAIKLDCDNDSLLIMATPDGPTCHKGTQSCFADESNKGFLFELECIIEKKIDQNDPTSYTNELFKKGINKIAQKVGEEAVEMIIEAKDNNLDLFQNEAADLLFHFLILLKAKRTNLSEVTTILRHRKERVNDA
ncbi:MAG: bifunctional phosphoribosyl-AMP cyclohydrolase/phosphoribosyl-ATP diphosphatase HisIE [Bacteroidota bacterium]